MDATALEKLWKQNQLKKAKLPELKQYLKGVKLSMAGELTDVAHRVKLHMDVTHGHLTVNVDGAAVSPFDLKPTQLRKHVALLGKDPQGNKDELLTLLIDHLRTHQGRSNEPSTTSGSTKRRRDDDVHPGVHLAQVILSLADDYPALLSASGIDVHPTSSTAVLRKAYFKLSLAVHPDKLPKDFADATKAFQALVTAYEVLSLPPELRAAATATADKGSSAALMRSNENCYRTPVYCPRCHEEWGLLTQGCEPFDYNFLMMGLKTFHCATCLFEFGCVTAEHACPHCHVIGVDYHPADYHRHVTCPHCHRIYGFYMYSMSARREKEYRAAIRASQEAKLQEKARRDERSKRASHRRQAVQDDDTQGKEKLFVMNLLDVCPRCGDVDVDSSEDARVAHLDACVDVAKIKRHRAMVAETEQRNEARAAAAAKQDAVQNAASWAYLGAKSADMWLLSLEQLHQMAKSYELETSGTRDELIARLVRHRNALDSKRMLGNGEAAAKKPRISVDDLPTNMERMTVAQLMGVCAAFGVKATKKTKRGLIDSIERAAVGNADEPLRLRNA
ncbi:Aste57867_16801 [Aphanomyces stellatus]|uniref:Aste57867_16801 protein n=1 Tax=Aphanomyces stellatus TaxID=120398 RepID=A0A485L863_9STRA|nr:hypothetical protein As57867_016744 [Aphanomyces stellatus]VFT93566.1 Aste57867_16801 [Aphanomyces stellatus]